jgi:phosphoglycolate phosphatase
VNFSYIHALAIDLDGTLLDTIGDLSGAANRTLRKLGFAEIPHEILKAFVGKGKAMHVRRALNASLGRDATDAEMQQAMTIYETEYFNHIDDTTVPYPGVIAGLDAMKEKGYPLACVTNKAKAFTVHLLARQGLAPYFDLVLGGDELPRSKPDPLMLTHTANHFKIPAAQLLMIGDSGNDALAARAAGAPVVLMDYGYTEGEPIAAIPNDGIFSSFEAIATRLPARR